MSRATIGRMPRPRPPRSVRAPRLRRPLPLIVTVLSLAVAACNPTTVGPTPSASPVPPSSSIAPPSASAAASPAGSAVSSADAAIYRAIEEQVIAIRGLRPKAPVDPILVDEAGIRAVTEKDFTKSNPPELIAANERILKAFELIPQDQSLRTLYLDLLGSQVAGLYSPDDKKLYVVSKQGGIGVVQRFTFSHEFTHALQDQNFDIGSLALDEVGEGDRSFARLTLVEGDASLLMTYWAIQELTAADLSAIANDPATVESNAQLQRMPAILRESLEFPYTQGLAFVQGIQTTGGWKAVDAAFREPPASTEQVLHPEKFRAHEMPLPADLPGDLATRLGAGWKIPYVDSFGEFQIGVWLRQSKGLSAADATAAAAGWGGDRMAVAEGPNGTWAVIWRTVWDTPADAAAFETAAADAIEALARPGAVTGDGRDRWIVVASDDVTLRTATSAAGLGS